VDALSGGQRQAIAVARCLEDNVRVACLDEPTAALGVAQTAQVLNLIRSLRSRGTGVIMITHDIASVLKVSERVVVLRHGHVAYEGATSSLSELNLLQLMAGMDLPAQSADQPAPQVTV
jgi:ABC-type sugar transport system ATPase subunit